MWLIPLTLLCAHFAAPSNAFVQSTDAPSKVKVVKVGAAYRLMVNGQPFFIKGVGGSGSHSLLVASGGNSYRTWGADNLEAELDEAQRLGLKVTVGIWLGHLEHGFKYDDPAMVANQLETAKGFIRRYKNHPALLMWGLGNEMEGSGDNPLIFKAVEDIAKAAKQIDPNHPTMTVIAELGGNKVQSINKYCPDIDIVGINSYGGATSVGKRYRESGGEKPYVLTEFGPAGVWEIGKNAWGAANEPTSTEKAEIYRNDYLKGVLAEPDLCLGSYAFLWGNKQEATATWFGMMLPDGKRLGPIDAMTELWSGKPAAHLCPQIRSLTVDESPDEDPGKIIHARLTAYDPEGLPLNVKWVLQREAGAYGSNGDPEGKPPVYPDAILMNGVDGATVKMPREPVGFRLFAYVDDGHGNAAVANVPLHVRGTLSADAGVPVSLPFFVYSDGDAAMPYSPAGWMGATTAMKVDPNDAHAPHSGSSCFRMDLNATTGWGAIAWQSPGGDWGDKPGGFDLTGAKHLTFWARGAAGGEKASFGVGLINPDRKYYDTAIAKLPDITLSQDWTQYSIDLTDRDLKRIKTGFVVTLVAHGSPISIYLDDIQFVKE